MLYPDAIFSNVNSREVRRQGNIVAKRGIAWRRQCRQRRLPEAALPPTALLEIESGLNTELLNAGAGASPILRLLICNSVFLTPAPLLVSFSRRATLPLSALHDAKERDGLRALGKPPFPDSVTYIRLSVSVAFQISCR